MKPTFAALIANYNDSTTIGEVICSVLEQAVPFDEVVIIDDASTDGSVALIQGLIKNIPHATLYCNEKNIGVVATLNRGFGLVKSEYVHMMSANDRYFSCIVEYGHKMVARYPGVAMVSANTALWDAVKGQQEADMVMRLPQMEAFIPPLDYIARNRMAPVSMNGGSNTIRRDIYIALDGQDPELKWYADWFLYFLIGFTYGFAYVPQRYSTYVKAKDSYLMGSYDPVQQVPVILHMLDLLQERYPAQAKLFKETAILPRYNLKIAIAILQKPYRWFMTPLLLWRCVGHQCAFWMKQVLPRRLLMALRSCIRL